MFFIAPVGTAEPPALSGPEPVAVRVRFAGAGAGNLLVELPREAAAPLAAGFLGADAAAIDARLVLDVVREMANMLCGAALSRIGERRSFRLYEPEVLPQRPASADPAEARCTVDIGTGRLTATLTFHQPCNQ
jgi:chemotaxis protein CheY-P-specific phosphatase CheC